jgi:hypothetical protein
MGRTIMMMTVSRTNQRQELLRTWLGKEVSPSLPFRNDWMRRVYCLGPADEGNAKAWFQSRLPPEDTHRDRTFIGNGRHAMRFWERNGLEESYKLSKMRVHFISINAMHSRTKSATDLSLTQ